MTTKTMSASYEYLDALSSSGDSDVSVIRHRESGEQFLLKCLREMPEANTGLLHRKLRFKHEMDIVSSLNHQNIAKPVFSLGENSIDSIAYPYRKGKTLAALLSASSIMPLEALHICRQLLDALEYIHCRGIVHCNINPANLYIDDDKGLQLLEFGYSMTEGEAARIPEGSVVGSFPYLSPEQMGFTAFKIDSRTDLYGAALVLYQMLSGKMPFDLTENTVEELLNRAIRTEVQPLHRVPLSINAILLKALKPTPAERYQTAAGFNLDLAAAMEHLRSESHHDFVAGRQDAINAVNRSRLFVARSREIDTCKYAYEQFLQGSAVSLCIHGKSGIGKSEIVNEFRSTASTDRVFFLSVKCNSFTPQQPYSIFRHLALDFIANINAGGKEAVTAFSVTAEKLLLNYSGVICRMVPEMKPFFREVLPIDIVESEKEADRTAHVLFTLLSTLCSFKPMVLFIDDLQWIDRVSFEIIRRLLRQQTPCMILATLQAEQLEGELHVFEFDLRLIGFKKFLPIMSFNRLEIGDLISSRFGAVNDLEKLQDLLVTKTDCSPFSLTEAFRFLVNNFIVIMTEKGWSLSLSDLSRLPEKLDPLSLILQKIKELDPRELQWLETASLAEGKFQKNIIESVGDFSADDSDVIVDILDRAGFFRTHLGGDFRFAHDYIQESIRKQISQEKKFLLYEKFGEIYEALAARDREYLFHAAEAYLKSRNLSKSISLSYEAARYAVEKVALDIAAGYFTKAQLMVSHCESAGIAAPIDITRLQSEFGDVLMLTGRHEQALKLFEKLLNDNKNPDKAAQLDLKYKIGTIYHNTGNFERSTKFFFEALDQLGIKFYSNGFKTVAMLIFEIVKQIGLTYGIKALIKPKDSFERKLSVRILNRLSFSLFYKNILLVQYAHFKALNIADSLINCAEKAETYAYHNVCAFMLLLKKRSLKYYRKAMTIAEMVNRKDMLAFSHSFGGVTFYYEGNWKNSENNLNESIDQYRKIGDLWGQIVPFETIVAAEIRKGCFSNCEPIIENLMNIDDECKDARGLASAHFYLAHIKFLTGRDNHSDWGTLIEEREGILSKVPLNKTISNIYILKKIFFNDQVKGAYDLSESILECIKQNNLMQEYVADAFSDRCEILIKEYYNRHFSPESQKQLPHSDRALLIELRKFCLAALIRGIMYPAHKGAAYRAIAWYNAFKGRTRIARHFFLKAIDRHHELDMKYEEAKSLAGYARFFEIRNQPGLGRDYFNRAYQLFENCGALVESDRIRDKVDAELTKNRERVERRVDIPIATPVTADQIRIDTLYEASLSLTQAEDVDTLLQRIVGLLIRATGAQHGLLRLERNSGGPEKSIAFNHENRVLPCESVAIPENLLARAKSCKSIVLWPDPRENDPGEDLIDPDNGSSMCVPLVRGDNYLGCVYLVNRLVAGLFSDNAAKAANIISVQAGFLIENARLMEDYKRLNAHLEEKVKAQTTDISEKARQLASTNLKLVESERMKELLSGAVVHDIKNFAAGISGHIKLLAYRHAEDRKTVRNIDLAQESCVDIINLASNLLDISKMEDGKLALQPRDLFFEEIAAIAQKYGRSVLFDEKHITVTIAVPDNDFVLTADPYLVERVIQNLFSNAAKYSESEGSLKLTFETTEKENILTFFSSGSPIPGEHREAIFEKYSRVDNKASHFSKGLGLFFCRMVMTAHQGRIWLESDERGNYFRLGFRKTERTA
jgi:signal transduction histidine kinase/serine/threonine protein kinase/tetratricopeptide (TPR) repeat protein